MSVTTVRIKRSEVRAAVADVERERAEKETFLGRVRDILSGLPSFKGKRVDVECEEERV